MCFSSQMFKFTLFQALGRVNANMPNGTLEDKVMRKAFNDKTSEIYYKSAWPRQQKHLVKYKRIKMLFWQPEFDESAEPSNDGIVPVNPWYESHREWYAPWTSANPRALSVLTFARTRALHLH